MKSDVKSDVETVEPRKPVAAAVLPCADDLAKELGALSG